MKEEVSYALSMMVDIVWLNEISCGIGVEPDGLP